jgi:hypothetical protein
MLRRSRQGDCKVVFASATDMMTTAESWVSLGSPGIMGARLQDRGDEIGWLSRHCNRPAVAATLLDASRVPAYRALNAGARR